MDGCVCGPAVTLGTTQRAALRAWPTGSLRVPWPDWMWRRPFPSQTELLGVMGAFVNAIQAAEHLHKTSR